MKALLWLVIASLFPLNVNAEQFVKDGMYCISEVCIGDDIADLAHVKWDKVQVRPIKANDYAMKGVIGQLAPQSLSVLSDAAPYVDQHRFDATGIAKLSKIKGFCETHQNYQGSFKSESGHPTYVTARIEPSADGSIQAIRVYSISRQYPKEYTNEQLAALKEQLTGRYGVPKHGEKDPSWGIGPDKGLFLRGPVDWDGETKRRDLMKAYPGCGKELKID